MSYLANINWNGGYSETNEEKILVFELNLNPKNNWMLTHWGLLNNPFNYDQLRATLQGLGQGCDKKSLSKFLPQIGLSKEVTKLIIKNVHMHNKYHIRITWNKKEENGTLEMSKLVKEHWEKVNVNA